MQSKGTYKTNQQLECKVKELRKQMKGTSLTEETLQGDEKKLKFYTGK